MKFILEYLLTYCAKGEGKELSALAGSHFLWLVKLERTFAGHQLEVLKCINK